MRQYHHMGIPTKEKMPGEKYIPNAKFTTTPFGANEFHIQWHRFDDDCELPDILKKVPHIAFKVDNLDEEIKNRNVIFGPYTPLEGYRVAMILTDDGLPIEFVETCLTDEELSLLESQAKTINLDGINIKHTMS